MPVLEPPPESLAFSIAAADDFYFVTGGSHRLDVISNDVLGRAVVSSVSQPEGGTARIEDGSIIVDLPPTASGLLTLTYTISDGAIESAATVTLNAQSAMSWVPATALADFGSEETETAEQQSLADRIEVLLRPPPIWLSLMDLELPLLPFTSALSLAFLGLLLFWIRTNRQGFLEVRAVDRTGALPARGAGTNDDDRRFSLRHDATEVWTTGRRRKRSGRIEVETPNGLAWVDQDRVKTL